MASIGNASQVAIGASGNMGEEVADAISDLVSDSSWRTAYGLFVTEELGKKLIGKSKYKEIPGSETVNVCMAIESRKPQVLLASAKRAALRKIGKIIAKPADMPSTTQTAVPATVRTATPSIKQQLAEKAHAATAAIKKTKTLKEQAVEAHELATVLRTRTRNLRTARRNLPEKNRARINGNIEIMTQQAKNAEDRAANLAAEVHAKYGLFVGPLAKAHGNKAGAATEGGKRKTRRQTRKQRKY